MATEPAVTIVTGAAGALGMSVTRVLLAAGHRVAGVDRAVDRLVGLDTGDPATLLPLAFDAVEAGAWNGPMTRIAEELGAPTGLVLCAGGWAGGTAVASETDVSTWQRMFEMNLETARAAVSAVLPGMVERRRGSIVVIGSRAVERPWESGGAAAYAAAKSALVAYAQTIAAEVLDQGVRVNAVLPSTIDTPANRAAMPTADTSRWVSAERLGRVIAFLLSEDAADISGAALPVYGRV